jgi:DNA-directed RNA polymerase subunit H (RpoH/RPB5)
MEPEKTDEKVINTEEVDEVALDKELEDSINSVKAGKELEPEKEEVKTEEANKEKPEEESKEATKSEDPSTPPVDEVKPEGEYDFRIPNKGKFESDESYEKRIELMDLVKKRKLAKTDEQRQQISEDIKTTKNQLKTINGSDKIINPLNENGGVDTKKSDEEDEALRADKERLRALGGATKEDIQEMLQRERLANEVKSTLDTFIGRHTELKDEDAREVFFDFVDNNFAWQNKSGKELMTVLELARESMFKPSETIQERVLKGANVQEKVNAMQFPGGTTAKTNYSPEVKQSLEELKATGLSEEKALELLSDE